MFYAMELTTTSINPTSEYHFSRALIGKKKKVNIHPYSPFSIHAENRTRGRTWTSEISELIQMKIDYF